jgi:FlaA1/EpsC-like NDP-sugar epimerase
MKRFNRLIKNLAMVAIDVMLVIIALALSVYLRFDWNVPSIFFNNLVNLLLPAVLISLSLFFIFGLYRRVWRYTGIDDMFLIAVAVSVSTGAIYLYSLFFGMLPRSSYIIAWFLLLFFVGGSRLAVRLLTDWLSKPAGRGGKKKILIIGAGEAGSMVARELKKHGSLLDMKVAGFIDDDPSKQRQIIQGLPVLGNRKDMPDVVSTKNIDEVVIAMPSASYRAMQEIISLCEGLDVKIKTVPGIYEILEGQISFSNLKEVDIEDLLRRLPVKQDLQGVAAYLTGLTVLVTGAGGSIGSELCRQIARMEPDRILLMDHNENGIFYILHELQERFPRVEYIPLVCDIKEHDALEKVFKEYRPDVVFHAAAHKHVPLMEANPQEAVRNNIMGSKNLIDLASEYAVKRFVFISTDKAVNPSSVMGSTKRVVEIYLQKKARICNSCIYCSVRFGNVLGSQGSVVLLFKSQISRGGPVTVTHPEMMRYFMTIPEAVQLVIQAGALCKGGEIFVLDMGEPIKIVDLARDMIILSGLKPEEDIKIEFTGLRPGEKLYEELFSDRESFTLTQHERIFIAPDSETEDAEINGELGKLGKRVGLGEKLVDLLWKY